MRELINKLKEMVMDQVDNPHLADTKELSLVVDMIKDLAEAEYHMKKSDNMEIGSM